MSLGSILRRAVGAFARSKSGTRRPVRRSKSPKAQLASGAARTLKKKL